MIENADGNDIRMIKFLIAGSLYPQYQRWAESKIPGLANMSFVQIVRRAGIETCNWAESWREGLEATGRFEVFVSYHNWRLTQEEWAREHNVIFQPDTWMADVLNAQLEYFRPDVLFINGWEFGASYVQACRRRFPGIKKVIGYDGVARHDAVVFRGTDIILSPLRESAAYYQSHGLVGHFFKRGFESAILGSLVNRPPTMSASFVGSVFLGEHAHNKRLRLLTYISRRTPIELFLNIHTVSEIPRIVVSEIIHRRGESLRSLVENVGAHWHLARHHRAPVFGKEMYQTLADSAISLNCHIDAAGASAGNMRLYEATGVGSCLVTDWKSNLNEFFEIDREIVAFHSAEECLEKLKYLTENDVQRKAIARSGQERTLRDHSLKSEVCQFGEILSQML